MRREGITTIAFVMILLVAISIAGTSMFLSRSAGRSTQWFLQAQRSQDLASTALKVVLARLEELGADPQLQGAGEIQRLVADLRAKNAPAPSYQLLVPKELYPWSEELTAQLSLWGEGRPDVRVTARVLDQNKLWTTEIRELPPDPRERSGWLQLTSTAYTKGRDGRPVGRTLVLERRFKTVSVRPPLLGRFALFVERGPGMDPNIAAVTFDASTGDARRASSEPQPLVVRSPVQVELVSGNRLRAAQVPSEALDRNGWIYLGFDDDPASGAAPQEWDLGLAHGYGKDGDSPQLPGRRVTTPDGDALLHGFAQGEEKIGAAISGAVTPPPPPVDATRCAGLRLFGSPDRCSPTLVFGPVNRKFRSLPLSGSGTAAAASPTVQSEWYLYSLEQFLYPEAPGSYRPDGVLDESGATRPAPAEFRSRVGSVQAWLSGLRAALLPATGAPVPVPPNNVRDGELNDPLLYLGDLRSGLMRFDQAMRFKAVYEMPAAPAKERLELDPCSLPGILLVPEPVFTGGRPGLVLGRLRINRGGILLVAGSIRLEGNVERLAGAGPVTLVSLKGNIVIGPGAASIDAHLVATTGTVEWPTACIIRGGVAARHLDLDNIKKFPAAREIEYDGVADPVTVRDDEDYRVLFGGDDKLAVMGVDER